MGVFEMRKTIAVTALLTGLISSAVFARSWDGYDRTVYVINSTSETLMAFYASNVGQNSWHHDLLGAGVVYPGNYVRAYLDDGTGYCRYDLKAVFSDGSTATRLGYNVCEGIAWTIYD
jgi:hypothetical protein